MIGRPSSTAHTRMGGVGRGAFIALLGLLLLGSEQVSGQRAAAAPAATTTTNAATTQETTSAKATTAATQTNTDTKATNTSPQTTSQTQKSNTDNTDSSNTSPTQKSTSSSDLPNLTSTSSSNANLPQLTSSSALPTLNTNLPSLTQNPANIPTYQVIIPQNIAQNPFLQTSSMPEGSVFIIVGSALAGLALMLIGWRAIYIYCLHRQTAHQRTTLKYAEMEQRPYNSGNGSSSSTTPFAAAGAGSQISLDYLRPGDRASRVSTFSSRPGTAARPSTGRPTTAMRPASGMRPASSGGPLTSSSVQFYSPSAHPGGTQAAVLGTTASRDSAYLPAGYYLRDAAGSRDSTISNSTLTPRQMYNTPNTTSFLYADPSAPPIPRLSRSPTAQTTSTMGGGYGGGGRPNTAGGGSSIYSGVLPRPSSGYREGQVYASQAYVSPQPRRGPSSSHGDVDRRSKPSQVLDELLGSH